MTAGLTGSANVRSVTVARLRGDWVGLTPLVLAVPLVADCSLSANGSDHAATKSIAKDDADLNKLCSGVAA